MKISESEIHIYQSSLEKLLPEVNSIESVLSEDELYRAGRYRFEKDRNHYAAGRIILRCLLSRYLKIAPSDIKFSYGEKGKPYVKGYSIKFNIAHSNGYAVYGFTSGIDVGIDIEFMRETTDAFQISEKFFSREEINELKAVDKDDINKAFFSCWTRKEAFIKAIGEGLSYPLSDFCVSLKPGSTPKINSIKKNQNEATQWSLYNIDVPAGFISSLAIKNPAMELIYFDKVPGIFYQNIHG